MLLYFLICAVHGLDIMVYSREQWYFTAIQCDCKHVIRRFCGCFLVCLCVSVFVSVCCNFSPTSTHPKTLILPLFLQVATRLKAATNPDKARKYVISSKSDYRRKQTQNENYPGYIYIFTSKIKIKNSFMLSPSLVTQKSKLQTGKPHSLRS